MNKTAIVFPGQGAQKVGMCFDFYEKFDSVKKIFDSLDKSSRELIFEGPQELLNLTINAQPSLFAADLACVAALKEIGFEADGAAGFSLGEIPALVYGGVFDFAQGLEFINFRAKTMQNCAEKNKGGMAAVMGLSAEAVVSVCEEINGAYPANFNSKIQTVVAFSENSFHELSQAVSSLKGKIIKLAVSGAFHSPLMNEAADEIKNFLEIIKLNDAAKPIYSNVTAQAYGDPKDLLSRHVNSPVKWHDTIENMINDGFGTFIEAGPGKTLTGLIKKINPDVKVFNVFDLQSLESLTNGFIGDL
ncbi:MAG: ACP S-malonyltransferase [Defluviitaleaceae bacterium]|nr:ACP S-malonyltransferase [Defluviitaleaceae bacterium]